MPISVYPEPASGGGTAEEIEFTPAGTIAATNVQDAIEEAAAEAAGTTDLTYTAATRVVASSTGTDATLTLADGSNPGLMTSADFTKLANLVSDLALKAPLASPTFTGTVTIPNGAALGTPGSVNLSNATSLADAALAATGTAGTYGSATAVPIITTDAKGRVTSVTTAAPVSADSPATLLFARNRFK